MILSTIRALALVGIAAAVPIAASATDGPELPDWMSVDHAAKTVTMTIVAGMNPTNNNWNFNGLSKGESSIVVPVGYTIEIAYQNSDPTGMVHSIGVGQISETTAAMFTDPTPAFAGAISASPADPVNATASGASETISFVADAAGDYALICYVPGHTLTGMWIGFRVTDDGTVGVQ